MKTRYLFFFGFEDPIEYETNRKEGTDFESIRAIWIYATSPESALKWGKTIAYEYVNWLFKKELKNGYKWKDSNFAFWVEEYPEKIDLTIDVDSLPEINEGHFPDFVDLDS